MKIGVLGSGQVGGGIARKLAALGHDVIVGSRSAADKTGEFPNIKLGTATEAARHGHWIVNALPGETSLRVLGQCDVNGKILIDISNYESAVDGPISMFMVLRRLITIGLYWFRKYAWRMRRTAPRWRRCGA